MRPLPPAALVVACAIAGTALGWAAWGEGRAPVLAILLPLAIASCRTRLQAFVLGGGYAIGVLRTTGVFIAGWFDNNPAVAVGSVLVYAAVAGATWSMGWSASRSPAVRAGWMALAWVLALAPPFALGMPGHPLVAAGYLAPGVGWAGVVLALAVAAFCGAVPALIERVRPGYLAAGVAVLVAALATAGQLAAGAPAAAKGVHAHQTRWGNLESAEQAIDRMQLMGRQSAPDGTFLSFWPESILGRWDPVMHQVLNLELLARARRAGRIEVVGMDIVLPGQLLLNGAVAFHPDGSTQTVVARQPAPMSLWRPWRSSDTFLADWRASNVLTLGPDVRAAVNFCYEEYLPVLYLLNELRDRPTMYVALANTWAARDRTAAAIQTWHSLGMARLFGRPYVKAENGPAN
jgi:hypothetical protein